VSAGDVRRVAEERGDDLRILIQAQCSGRCRAREPRADLVVH
jgi:hypothetical protein